MMPKSAAAEDGALYKASIWGDAVCCLASSSIAASNTIAGVMRLTPVGGSGSV